MALQETFLPALYKGVGEGTPGWGVTSLPVKQAGIALPDLTKTSPENWTASCVIIGNIVASIRVQEDFITADHAAYIREEREEVMKSNNLRLEEALAETLEGAAVHVTRHLRQATKTGKWMMVQSSTVNRMELGAQYWLDALFLQYGLDLPYLSKFCDGCNATFYMFHSLDCKKGGLVTARHTYLCDRVTDWDGKAFTPIFVHDDPLIIAGRAM